MTKNALIIANNTMACRDNSAIIKAFAGNDIL
jgi:hypothetical protein